MYHVMTRGNEQKDIFRDDEDKSVLIHILKQKKLNSSASISAICIMSNHMHLLGKFDPLSDLSKYMSKINTSYASYFNKKYIRVGHVFQGRFKSETIKNEHHFLACLRYIHNNPVKAAITQKPGDYPWCSYSHYLHTSSIFQGLIDTQTVLSSFSPKHLSAIKEFKQFSLGDDQDLFIECQESIITVTKTFMSYSQANQFLQVFLHSMKMEITDLTKPEHIKKRKLLIQQLKRESNLSLRQIAELLKINKNSVINAL